LAGAAINDGLIYASVRPWRAIQRQGQSGR
jgi:hypothetical protein